MNGLIDWLRGTVAGQHNIDGPDLTLLQVTDDVEEACQRFVTSRVQAAEARADDDRSAD